VRKTSSLPVALRASHDHDHCLSDALGEAETLCAQRGARLTPIRRRVLEIIWQSHAPIGAYDILDALRKEGRSAQPPTVYRALDFLLAQGLAHRITSLNAYIGCTAPGRSHGAQMLICERCGTVAEIDDMRIGDTVTSAARAVGFRVTNQALEVVGVCRECAQAATRPRRQRA
jgi:Fur family transcriptional regulator, zinc uptake regulator